MAALDPFTVEIADFGLSKDATDSFLPTFCGLALYVASEVFHWSDDKGRDRERYGLSTDIWWAGVIFLSLIYNPSTQPSMGGMNPRELEQPFVEALVQ